MLPSHEPTSSPELHQPEPFPTVPVLTASFVAVAVGAGLMLYIKKRKRQGLQAIFCSVKKSGSYRFVFH